MRILIWWWVWSWWCLCGDRYEEDEFVWVEDDEFVWVLPF